MNKHIKKWSEKLLDLSKRNNLISFKDSKTSVIDVLFPNISNIFNNMMDEKLIEIYEDFICNEQLDEESNVISISPNKYIECHLHRMNQNQILLFKDKVVSKKILKNINKINTEFFQEKGLNVVHMSFGFINWSESNDSSRMYKTPILLMPISLDTKSTVDAFTVKKQDDVFLNPTFKYKLKVEYNIELEDYNSSILIEDYLDYITTMIEKLNWFVSKDVKISNLPFSKINMYIDLIENENLILNNPVIENLINGSEEYGEIEEVEIKNRTQLNVVSADSSQMEAIDLALKGKSFVLEGPPGTGKSQTITNIIAALLAEGKKVLFVSEKKAALDVVFNNMKKVNLEQFCIPLHGTKLNKKEFINDIYETMCSGKKSLPSACDEIIEHFGTLENNLDEYNTDLHKKYDVIDMSLYQVMAILIKYEEIEDVEYVINNISSIGSKRLKEIVNNLEKIKIHFNNYGLDFTKYYFYGVKQNELTYQFNLRFKKQLASIIEISNKLLSNSFVNDLRNNSIKCIIDTINFKKSIDSCSLSNNEKFFSDIEYYFNNIIELSELSNKINEIEDDILNDFKEDIFDIDSNLLNEKLVFELSSSFKRFFSSEYKNIVKKFKVYSISSKKLSYTDLIIYSEKLKKYSKLQKQYEEVDKINNLDIKVYSKRKTNWEEFIKNVSFIKDNIVLLDDYKILSNVNSSDFISFSKEILNLNECITDLDFYDVKSFNINTLIIHEVNKKISDILENYDALHAWMNFLNDLEISKNYDVYDFLLVVKNKYLDKNILVEYYLKTFYLQWYDIMVRSTSLKNFDVDNQDRFVTEFKRNDDAVYKITKDKIISRLSNDRPNISNKIPGSAAAILSREHEKKSKVKSILTLMTEIPQFIQDIKPCFLMSPLAVSTYLNPKKVSFDVTIFDEASQIFPHDAVGALYRSKQAIVVGDSKQMPPTNFFNSNSSEEEIEDEEQSDVDAFESVLDLFNASFPTRSLLWHYRSKVETLISFSNEKYYNNNLISFPSTYADEQYYGVDFHFVKNGMYSAIDRFNIQEANRVVDLIFDNIKNHPNRSLGVIAFNKAQQDKIEGLLEDRRKQQTEFEEFFNKSKEEAFFIKNLETVQGDERDTIIFSICFGKNANGVFKQNFGPLSQVGGERRLNVAVTRAKYNLQVVSSIEASDINIANVKNDGPKHLRTYLDFAKNGLVALDREMKVENEVIFDSPFEEEVYNFLKSKGFDVDTQVGCSNYRIDLALKTENSSNYYLAIECDGATYHSSKNARDRDKLRQLVLENMGWKFYRIWSTDWFRNNKSSKEKLLTHIQKIKDNEIIIEENVSLYSSNLLEKEEQEISFTEYNFFDIENINRLSIYSKEFSVKINEWIRFESPLSKDVILKTVCHNFHSEKVTQRVKNEFSSYFKKADDIILKDGFYFYGDSEKNGLRVIPNEKRELEFISSAELANGLYFILESTSQCNKEDLFKFLAKELGYKNVTGKSLTILNKAFTLLEPYTIEENDMYRIDKSIEF